jgi:hypothetical protein
MCDGLERAGADVRRGRRCVGIGTGTCLRTVSRACTSFCYFVLEELLYPEPWRRLQFRWPFRPVPLQKVQAESDVAILQGYLGNDRTIIMQADQTSR